MDLRVDGTHNLIQNMLTGSISNPKQLENNLAQTTQDIIRRQNDTVTISAMGQHINELYSKLQAEESEQALTGFRQLMTDLAAAPDSLDTLMFVDTATRLSEADTGVFTETFETVNTLEEEGISFRGWFRTLNSMNAEQVETYIEITDQIRSLDEELRDGLLTQLMTAVNEIALNKELSEEELEALMTEFLSNLAEIDSATGIAQYITDFMEELL